MSSKSVTWQEFMKGVQDLPQDMREKVLPEIRTEQEAQARVLEKVIERFAYNNQAMQGGTITKKKTRNTRSSLRMYGKNLAGSIESFTNKKNKDKAYAVIGLLPSGIGKGGAIYGWMQLAGYRPGRNSKTARQKAGEAYGFTKKGISGRAREELARKKTRVQGKKFFEVIYSRYGEIAQQRAMQSASKKIDKMLEAI